MPDAIAATKAMRELHAALTTAAERYAEQTGKPQYVAASLASAFLCEHAANLHSQYIDAQAVEARANHGDAR